MMLVNIDQSLPQQVTGEISTTKTLGRWARATVTNRWRGFGSLCGRRFNSNGGMGWLQSGHPHWFWWEINGNHGAFLVWNDAIPTSHGSFHGPWWFSLWIRMAIPTNDGVLGDTRHKVPNLRDFQPMLKMAPFLLLDNHRLACHSQYMIDPVQIANVRRLANGVGTPEKRQNVTVGVLWWS